MYYRSILCVAFVIGSLTILAAADSRCGEPSEGAGNSADPGTGDSRLSVGAAKERAQLMHRIYLATLDAMHHHYFHSNKAVLPARAMEDIFAEVARETQTTANWISVNTKAMSVHHEPATDFEKKAAAELGLGKSEVSVVEKGFYRRAVAIPLGGGCVSCHSGTFTAQSQVPRYAGLVISIPVGEE